MFTGIIQKLGKVKSVTQDGDAKKFQIETLGLTKTSVTGDSLAVNGACMTLVCIDDSIVEFMTISESLKLTNLDFLVAGDSVNLELAATLNTVLGGHIVSGHVDTLVNVVEIIPKETGREVWLQVPSEFLRFIIPKGSVCLDGISLTVAELKEDLIRIAFIPETLERTTAGIWEVGSKVNLEIDQIARHVARQLEFKTEG